MKYLLIALSLAAVANQPFARTAHNAAAATSAPAPASAATAADVSPPGTPQRSRMKACNADAKSKALHGDDRRAFMKQCLSGKAKAAVAS